jgi:hypothetical protein
VGEHRGRCCILSHTSRERAYSTSNVGEILSAHFGLKDWAFGSLPDISSCGCYLIPSVFSCQRVNVNQNRILPVLIVSRAYYTHSPPSSPCYLFYVPLNFNLTVNHDKHKNKTTSETKAILRSIFLSSRILTHDQDDRSTSRSRPK